MAYVDSYPTLNKVTDPQALKSYLRKAVIETYTNVLHGEKADAGIVRNATAQDYTRQVEVLQNKDGGFQFLYKNEAVVDKLLGREEVAPATARTVLEESAETPEGAQIIEGVKSTEGTDTTGGVENANADAIASAPTGENSQLNAHFALGEPLPLLPPNDAWLSLPLHENHLLAIHKRILVSTGHRLSDNALSHSATVSSLLKALAEAAAPPPEKLDLLAVAPELTELGNVKVLKTRLRPVDKEIEVGRLNPGTKEWLDNKRRKEAGLDVDGHFTYKWDEGKYFVAL